MSTFLIRAAAALAVVVLLYSGVQVIEQRGYDRATAKHTAALEALKRSAAETLARETQAARAAEQALQTFKQAQELTDAQHQQAMASLSDRLRSLAGPAGRLRDPHAAGCGAGRGGAQVSHAAAPAGGAGDAAEAGGVLSEPLDRLLRQLAGEADAINVAYASCRAWAEALTTAPR